MAVDDSYTKALLHMNGTDTSTTFTDESGKAWVAVGNAQIDTAQSKFGGASGLSDGTGDYVYRNDAAGDADFAFGTGDWTIDFWLRFNSTAGAQIVYDQRPAATTGWYPTIYKDGTTGVMKFFSNGADRITGTTSMSTATWYHIAVARGSGSTRLFINGTQEGSTFTDSNTYLNSAYRPLLFIDNGTTYCLNGWMDELRISKGIARWTTNFTPPTAEYGAATAAFAKIKGVTWSSISKRRGVAVASIAKINGVSTS